MLTMYEQETVWPSSKFLCGRRDDMKLNYRVRRSAAVIIAIILVAAIGQTAYAQKNNAKKLAEASREAQKASDAFTEIMNIAEKAIPQSLLDRAEAIAVFPGVIKAGFIIGGRGGHGVISRRVKGGWSAPAAFDLGGGSVGLQIGASRTDFVLLFMNDDALEVCLKTSSKSA